ncbi:hypothetical protein KDA_09800 [Dictyobacter alpinus]|uniref:Uncharacterized protein n=1 Tax=Dictyobacter alpinus TaxID=2014873 RepID=A0A402B2A6_9CHLR|nr:hypothetical protein [Dictyobacter alpinus]GCE25496.1 hypothetical protein KDA_09800 [Dictyobacter alpinus]
MREDETEEQEAFSDDPAQGTQDTEDTNASVQAEHIDTSVLGTNYGSVVNNNGLSLNDTIKVFQMMMLNYHPGHPFDPSALSQAFTTNQTYERKKYAAAMAEQEFQDGIFENEISIKDAPGAADPNAMPADIDDWYYDSLDEYERYYVITVAMLQGSPASEITKKARELYHSMSNGEVLSARSASRLRKRTYTLVQEGGDPRIFWQNPELGPRILHFIAEESVEWPGSQPGQSFIDMLQSWPEGLNGENSRRSARALGSILAYQNINQLWRVANTWADRKTARDWRTAASLLAGAYETNVSKTQSKNTDALVDSLLRLLSQWTERWIQSTNPRVGCAAAYTYGLIGRHLPLKALQGLEQLQNIPQRNVTHRAINNVDAFPSELASAIVSAYVTISLAGHIRSVLDALATQAEQLTHHHQPSTKISSYLQEKRQREVVLNIIFDAFFLIAASSLSTSNPTINIPYNIHQSLPEQPTLPDRNKQDTLLSGILAINENQWRQNLSILLCAAIIEGKSKPAIDLLHQWASIILSQSNDQSEELYTHFVEFMVNLGKMLQCWQHDQPDKSGHYALALQAYENRLTSWLQEGGGQSKSIGMLARHILQQADW